MTFSFQPAAHLCVWLALLIATCPAVAQDLQLRFGEEVSPDVEQVYNRGLDWLSANQSPDGTWAAGQGGPAIVGICTMALLASGEDPNFGKFSENIRRSVRQLLTTQDQRTGYFGGSMYHHGFAMLALAEAYGAVDDTRLWEGDRSPASRRTIAQGLELAVRCAVTAQASNPYKAWRYSPDARDADTSVTGAILMGLLAARNAGVKVPDECIDQGLAYFNTMTSEQGDIGYSGIGGGGSDTLKAIAVLVYSIGKRKDAKQFEPLVKRITAILDRSSNDYPEYSRYYNAQALFQSDMAAWKQWNQNLIRLLKENQSADGSFPSSYGPAYGTGMSLLALGLNYRFLPIYER